MKQYSTPFKVNTTKAASDREQELLREAKDRWKRSQEAFWQWRKRALEDLKFRDGDSDNGWQWPEDLRAVRAGDNRPCLTMNMVRQHNLQISNDLRKAKSSVKFVGTGNGATQESANVWQDLYRHFEWKSSAQGAYTLARNYAIDIGLGFWRVVTDYEGDESMDLDFCHRPMIDPMSVFLDPDCQDLVTFSDGQFAFVFDTMPKDDFEDAYPKMKDLAGDSALGEGSVINEGLAKNQILVAEYFRRVQKQDKLLSFVSGGERHTAKASALHADVVGGLLDDPATRWRHVWGTEIEWYLVAGQRIIDHTTWPGSRIPLIPVVGEVRKIEGQIDFKGHTRAMKDAQRMYNVNASAQVEFVGLQGKTPWVVPVAGIEELESIWQSANRVNHAVLPYNDWDAENARPIPPPQRTQPPSASPAYQAGMDTAFNQMMMVSGQYQNQMGMMGNERTGAAIGKRQEQSDTAVFHFQDNYESSLMYCGRMFLEVAPKILDTKRVLRIQAEDGTESDLAIDPTARAAYLEEVEANNALAKRILNPQRGSYAIAASVGPSYESKREETEEKLTLVLTQAPALAGVMADLLLGSMNFDKAQEAAKRLKRMVPPQALGVGPTPTEQAMQQQIAALQQALQKSLEHVAKTQLKLVGKDQMRDIDVYDAETKRMSALQKMLPQDPEGLQQMISDLVKDSMQTHLGDIITANANDIDATPSTDVAPSADAPPLPGASKAPDGNWYLADPTRKSKYLKIAPLAQQRTPGGQV